MAKRKISADVAIKDIRSGMSDAELMGKYRLSAKGLQSLFKKLLAVGLIKVEELDQRMPTFMGTVFVTNEIGLQEFRVELEDSVTPARGEPYPHLSIESVLKDIREGATDPTLMKKYNLSSAGLQSLLEHLVFSGLMTQIEADQRLDLLDSTIDVHGWKKRIEDGAATGARAMWECPACGKVQPRQMEECPVCGVIIAKFKKKMAAEEELTS